MDTLSNFPGPDARMQDNLNKTCSQIADCIGNRPKRGLVAIAIDEVIGADKTVWEAYDETPLTQVSKDVVKEFLWREKSTSRR